MKGPTNTLQVLDGVFLSSVGLDVTPCGHSTLRQLCLNSLNPITSRSEKTGHTTALSTQTARPASTVSSTKQLARDVWKIHVKIMETVENPASRLASSTWWPNHLHH